MKKSINPTAITIQRRFFIALDDIMSSGRINGLKGFCDKYRLNRSKYSVLKNDISGNRERTNNSYKLIDIDSLAYLCDYGVSAEWLLTGKGNMYV